MIQVLITGTSPILQNRYHGADLEPQAMRGALITRPSAAEEAAASTYRNAAGLFFHPGSAISRLIREAGSYHKMRGSRRSVKTVIPAAVLVLNEQIILADKAGAPLADFEIDSRAVVIPATRGRIMKHRARFNEWAASFRIRINEEILPADEVRKLLVQGGQQIGIGDFRPEKGGNFGTFNVTGWEEANISTTP